MADGSLDDDAQQVFMIAARKLDTIDPAGEKPYLLGIAVKASDLRRRRTDAAVALQGRIADALLADPTLGHQPIVATAHTPFWGRSPVTLEVSGPVPSPELREAAMSLVIREAFNSGLRFRVEDRIVVDPRMSRAAAA